MKLVDAVFSFALMVMMSAVVLSVIFVVLYH